MAFERRSGRPSGDTVFHFSLKKSRGIDGILTPNDLVALLLEGELLSAGLTIPGDIALVGFDNEPFSA